MTILIISKRLQIKLLIYTSESFSLQQRFSEKKAIRNVRKTTNMFNL